MRKSPKKVSIKAGASADPNDIAQAGASPEPIAGAGVGFGLPSLEDVRRERRVGQRTEQALANALNTWEANKRPDWWTRWLAIVALVATVAQFAWGAFATRLQDAAAKTAAERPVYAAVHNVAELAARMSCNETLGRQVRATGLNRDLEVMEGYFRQLDIQEHAAIYAGTSVNNDDLRKRIEARQDPKFGKWFDLIFHMNRAFLLSSSLTNLLEAKQATRPSPYSGGDVDSSIANVSSQLAGDINRASTAYESLIKNGVAMPRLLVLGDGLSGKNDPNSVYLACSHDLACLYCCFVVQQWFEISPQSGLTSTRHLMKTLDAASQ